jgi:hypothetical protein
VLTERPEIAPVADELAKSAGFQDENGDAALGGPVPTIQQQPEGQPAGGRIPDALQADGALRGIETPENDGLAPQGAM